MYIASCPSRSSGPKRHFSSLGTPGAAGHETTLESQGPGRAARLTQGSPIRGGALRGDGHSGAPDLASDGGLVRHSQIPSAMVKGDQDPNENGNLTCLASVFGWRSARRASPLVVVPLVISLPAQGGLGLRRRGRAGARGGVRLLAWALPSRHGTGHPRNVNVR
jgi:hypothetical protein